MSLIKLLLIFTVSLSLSFSLKGQSEKEKFRKWEFGVDIAKVNYLLPDSWQKLEKSPFTLYYLNYTSPKKLKRISLGADLSGLYAVTTDSEVTFADNEWDVNLAVAFLKIHDTRWKFVKVLAGWDTNIFFDATLDYRLTDALGGDIKNNRYALTLGYGPDVGLKFVFSEKLSLYVHSNFHFNIYYTSVNREISNSPEEVSRNIGYSFSEYLPKTFILTFNF